MLYFLVTGSYHGLKMQGGVCQVLDQGFSFPTPEALLEGNMGHLK